ncbi:hypothetical protein K2224_10700 [Streptomyces sp. BHT-5-2]|uniref:hypothetical protein n=1 Tax=Streptomyces sp. BHT-5-2 TaxID=2866715 RepID=UPI001C8DA477|nr:hypothetical protein [Streptomyces sp. BHT-5-2]QZL03604.1 hypothetical protein K2224_10700 [Streptomyces sp. BHT-5-2]
MTNPMDTARLLPWTSPDGKPCYLLGGNGTGYVSRLADKVEAEQMNSAAKLIEEACGILTDCTWSPGEIQLLAVELNHHLAKVHRVSESRGPGPSCGERIPGAPLKDAAQGPPAR